ncbi:MAG: DUF2975 domain-containing protein [Candidatus Berkiellales bacterium]
MKSFSKKIHLLFQVLLFATPLFLIFYWFNVDEALSMGINPFGIPENKKVVINGLSKAIAFSISLFSTALVMLLFYRLAKLFKNYHNGVVFSEENIQSYKKLGKYLFLFPFVDFISTGLMTVAFSFQNPTGERYLGLTLQMSNMLPIIIGLVIVGIAYVMQEAQRLEEEMHFTI